MKMEKLVMEGFKSFKRKSAIYFPGGFSVLTGPNGAGKSCIIDAISFVLGKGTRAMRAKKLHELIFHGSRKKSPSDFARVSLFFDNSCKTLPLKEESVSVTRRVNKAGISTYRLNGQVVTRQQVLDLFSRAMIQSDGYNIIQQGDVTNIIEMLPTERREIIDDIAGIAEYDDKKAKAEKELEKVDEKIREAEIMLESKDEFLTKLKTDRDAALEFKKLQDGLEITRASAIWNDLQETENSLKDVDSRIGSEEKELTGLQREIEELDKNIQEGEGKLQDMARDMEKVSKQIEETKKIERLRSEIERKRDRIDSNNRNVENLASMIERLKGFSSVSPGMKKVLGFPGVFGMVRELIMVPKQYRIAAEVAAGGRLRDMVVDTTDNAVKCIKYLKENRIGRARFLPLDRIKSWGKKPLPTGCIGWLSELIHHEPKFTPAIESIFATTACVKDIDRAKEIAKKARVRMVTLDGDIMEASGAIYGGFYKKKRSMGGDITEYQERKKKLEKENEILEKEIVKFNKELEALAEKEKKSGAVNIEIKRGKIGENLTKMREKRTEAYEKRLAIQQKAGDRKVRKAKLETRLESLKLEWESVSDKIEKDKLLKEKVSTLKGRERYMRDRLETLGAVNMKAIEEYDVFRDEFDEMREKIDRIVKEKDAIEGTVKKIEEKRMETFTATLDEVTKHFKTVYSELTGGEAELKLEDPSSTDSGLIISASPPGKKLLSIDTQSGGERALTALSFLFGIQRHKPAPFYILDEADASLDKTNTKCFVEMIKKQAKGSQFILISHNDQLIKEADQVYGITMEDGESKVMAVKLPKNN